MTDQPNADRPSQADAFDTATPARPPVVASAQVDPSAAASVAPPAAVAVAPPSVPAAPITAPPTAGGDWQSAPPSPGFASQGGIAYAPSLVQPIAAARAPRRGLRWLVAAIVVVLVAVSASAVFIAVAGSGSSSTVARWAPADSIVYLEARMDLPGDQHDKVGQFLSAFPGFADPSTLDTKLGEIFDKAVKSASNDKADYTSDIKPWFGGEAALSLSAFPTMSGTSGMQTSMAHGAFLLSVTDAAKASAWLAGVVKGDGTTATYGGVTLTALGTGDSTAAVGVDGTVLIGGDLDTVHAIIDGKGSAGLASTADYKRAVAAAPKDRVGFMFFELQKYMSTVMAMMPAGTGATAYPKELLAQIPDWAAMSGRFESNAFVLDEVAPYPTGTVVPADHASTIAGHLPASTIASYEVHDLGKTIQNAVTSYEKIPAYKDGVTQVLDALDKVGGLDSFVSWLGDADVAVTLDGTTVGGGLVVTLPDAKAATDASAKFAALKNLVSVTGLKTAKVTTETHGDATITTIDLGSVKDLQALSGSSSTTDGLPAEVADARVSLSYTVTDTLAIVGIGGDTFVKAVLDTKAGSSLADQPRYKAILGIAGASNDGLLYVDLASIVKAAEAAVPADAAAKFNSDVKPYLAPFSALGMSSQNGDLLHARVILTVTK